MFLLLIKLLELFADEGLQNSFESNSLASFLQSKEKQNIGN